MMIHTSQRASYPLRIRRRMRMKYRRWMGPWRQPMGKRPHWLAPKARWRWMTAADDAEVPF